MTDRRGRTRAAKKRAVQRLKETVYNDDEVDFHPKYDESVYGHSISAKKVNEGTTSDNSSSVSDSVQSGSHNSRAGRVAELEQEIWAVRSRVDSMDAKLDLLIAAAHPNPVMYSSTPHKRTRPVAEDLDAEAPPPPRRLRQEVNKGGYVDTLMQQENFRPGHVEGKTQLAPDIFTETLLAKPYMYVNREGCATLKQKLEVRTSLSPMVYVNATIRLVNDSRACAAGEREHILRHLQDVTHDVMVRPWENVRRWSQYVWDAVERREIAWDDTQSIHNHRMTIALTGPGRTGTSGSAESRTNRQKAICRPFNARGGCRHRSHHDEGQVRFLHICAFCDSVGRHCPGHNVLGCNNKTQFPGQPRYTTAPNLNVPPPAVGARQGADLPAWRQQPQHHNAYNYYGQAAPKNGQ